MRQKVSRPSKASSPARLQNWPGPWHRPGAGRPAVSPAPLPVGWPAPDVASNGSGRQALRGGGRSLDQRSGRGDPSAAAATQAADKLCPLPWPAGLTGAAPPAPGPGPPRSNKPPTSLIQILLSLLLACWWLVASYPLGCWAPLAGASLWIQGRGGRTAGASPGESWSGPELTPPCKKLRCAPTGLSAASPLQMP